MPLNAEQMNGSAVSTGAHQTSALKIINRASQLTQRLLAFSRQPMMQPKTFKINDALASFFDILKRKFSGAIDLQFKCFSNLKLCKVDEAQLENVILNLVFNAKGAMPECRQRRVIGQSSTPSETDYHLLDAISPGSYIEIQVNLSSKEMSSEILKLAVEPFFTTKGVGERTGLGPSMVYGFVKQSGGHVHIESTPDNGIVVKIFFCVSPERSLAE